ncbi:uncharacterized protein [Montipora foliosa]|uniref:uncharacterized protein isoform X1 n=2 Tax=Montipora foliosa TaxID=591990 RepID=UPI0035F208EE
MIKSFSNCLKSLLSPSFLKLRRSCHEKSSGCKIMDPCIDNLEKHAEPGTEPVLDLFVAYMWQELTFVKKQGLCKEVSSEDLRKYALASGVMARHNLINIEQDPNDECAELAFSECFFREGNQHASYLKQADAYLKCEETKGKRCDAPIWKHYHATVDAWRKEFETMHG